MTRPRIPRRIRFRPDVTYFKPRGIPLRELEEVELKPDEMEAIKLHNLDGLDQKEAAASIGVSQPTFARILAQANKKIADAISNGKAIRIENLP